MLQYKRANERVKKSDKKIENIESNIVGNKKSEIKYVHQKIL